MIDRAKVTRVFKEYVSDYDITDDKIRLKVVHTYKVAENSERIARSLDLNGEDTDLAWLIGMLHDIGRFEQLRRFHTFVDADSIDHAKFGADLLFEEGLIRRFLEDESYYDYIETAIRAHNLFVLGEDPDARRLMFSKIIRDADKIDIFRVNDEFSKEVVYDTTREELMTSALTDEVVEASLNHVTVLRSLKKTPADTLVSHISLVYGIYYRESIVMLKEQGYLDKLMNTRLDNPDTNHKLEEVSREVKRYMDNYQNDL